MLSFFSRRLPAFSSLGCPSPSLGLSCSSLSRSFGSKSRWRQRMRKEREEEEKNKSTNGNQSSPAEGITASSAPSSSSAPRPTAAKAKKSRDPAASKNPQYPPEPLTDAASAAISRRALYKSEIRPFRYFCRTVPEDGHPPIQVTKLINSILKSRGFRSLGDQETVKRVNYPLWHLANRGPSEFSIAKRVFTETLKRLPELQKKKLRVLDYGSAVGVNLPALLELIPKNQIDYYLTVEPSPGLAAISGALNAPWTQGENGIPVKYKGKLDSLYQPGGDLNPQESDFDLIFLCSSLVLLGQEKRRDFLFDIWKRLNRGGAIIIIEDGTEEGFKIVRHARQALIEKFGIRNSEPGRFPSVKDKKSSHAAVLAPCGHDRTCPMSNPGEICRFAHRIYVSSLPALSPLRDLKSPKDSPMGGLILQDFSYVVMHKGNLSAPAEGVSISPAQAFGRGGDLFVRSKNDSEKSSSTLAEEVEKEILARENIEGGENEGNNEIGEEIEEEEDVEEDYDEEIDEEEAMMDAVDNVESTLMAENSPPASDLAFVVPGELYHSRFSRLLTPPLKRGGHVIIDVCSTEGQLKRWVVPKSLGLEGGYSLTKQLKWGDLMPFQFEKGEKRKHKKVKPEEGKKDGEKEIPSQKVPDERSQAVHRVARANNLPMAKKEKEKVKKPQTPATDSNIPPETIISPNAQLNAESAAAALRQTRQQLKELFEDRKASEAKAVQEKLEKETSNFVDSIPESELKKFEQREKEAERGPRKKTRREK